MTKQFRAQICIIGAVRKVCHASWGCGQRRHARKTKKSNKIEQ